jgi:hypothetical protein
MLGSRILWARNGDEEKKGASMNIGEPANHEKNPALAGQEAVASQDEEKDWKKTRPEESAACRS